MKVILCGGATGPSLDIARRLLKDDRVSDLAIFTHLPRESIEGIETLLDVVSQNNLWRSTNSINETRPPFEPDMIVSIYYRTIIKEAVIDSVQGRIFNAHTSLLPRNRGRSPVPWAIVNDDRWTGVTYHYIDAGIDTGPIILQGAVQITDGETQASLFEKINQAVVDYFPAALELVLAGFPGIKQRGEPSYHTAGPPHGGEIDSEWTWGKIMRFVRAMTYPPLPYAKFDGQEIKSEDDYRQALYDRHRRRIEANHGS